MMSHVIKFSNFSWGQFVYLKATLKEDDKDVFMVFSTLCHFHIFHKVLKFLFFLLCVGADWFTCLVMVLENDLDFSNSLNSIDWFISLSIIFFLPLFHVHGVNLFCDLVIFIYYGGELVDQLNKNSMIALKKNERMEKKRRKKLNFYCLVWKKIYRERKL